MEPVGPGAVADLELVDVPAARANHIAWMAVHPLRNEQSVPVHDAGLRYPIEVADADLVPLSELQDRPREAVGNRLQRVRGTLQHAADVAPHLV